MKEGSSIINTTSVNAYKGNAKLLDYTSTKGAIVAFTRGLSLQLVGKGIRVNGGGTWTHLDSFNTRLFQGGRDCSIWWAGPMKRAGQPIEVAPSYVFLACNQCSSYITGQVLHPNGNYNTKLNVSKYIYCIRNIICTSICISLLTLACLFLQGEPL